MIWNITDISEPQAKQEKQKATLPTLFVEECATRGIKIIREGKIMIHDDDVITISSWVFGESTQQINLVDILVATRNKWLKETNNV